MNPNEPFSEAKWLTVPPPQVSHKAQWIWVQKDGDPKPDVKGAPPGTVHFVKEIILPSGLGPARISFTADNECTVKINGKTIGSSERWEQMTDVQAPGLLVEGKNRIEVVATNGTGNGILNPAGFLFTLSAPRGSMGLVYIDSDESWTSPDGKVVSIGDYYTAPWNLSKPEVPCPVYRTDFELGKGIKKAIAKVIGLGHYDFYANGKRLGDGLLNQAWSQYDKALYWKEFDLTDVLKPGPNAMGAELGNSFYRVVAPLPGRYVKGDVMPNFSVSTPFLLAVELDVEYQDGTHQRVLSDGSWKRSNSPYTFSHIYGGEDFDARQVQAGWNQPGFKDESWSPAVFAPKPKVELRKQDWPEFKAIQSWKPTEIKNPKPGIFSYLFPQNASAIVRMKVRGKRGGVVKLKPSEVISAEGEVQQLNLSGEASCSYTLDGSGLETHEWRFWYHGFQFVEMTGGVPAGMPNPKNLPVVESLELVHVRTDNPQVGTFETSNKLFNQTHNLVDWAMQSNMSYVMSDCPHREKMGWLECAHLLFRTFAYRYDSRAWFHKIAEDIRDQQLPDGRITTVAPAYLMLPPSNPFVFTVEWGAAGVLMPWQAYEWYGDKRFLSENFDSMCRFVDWLDANAQDGLAPIGLGDWYDYGHGNPPGSSRYTPTNLSSTAMWAMCSDALAKSADALGRKSDAEKYRQMTEKIKGVFLAKFYDPVAKTFKNTGSCQTANSMALCANLVPVQDREAVLNNIIAELQKRDYQQTPGDIGHLYFVRALAEAGRSDVLHKVYSRTGIGSYGGIIAKGLTTLPESWDATTVGSNSLNHCMLGHIMEWFYGWVLGIRQAPNSMGWKHILIAPEPGSLKYAKGETVTPHGKVAIEWKKTGQDFIATVIVPKGTKATVVLPVKSSSLTVDGKLTNAKIGAFGRASVEVAPGKHVFRYDA